MHQTSHSLFFWSRAVSPPEVAVVADEVEIGGFSGVGGGRGAGRFCAATLVSQPSHTSVLRRFSAPNEGRVPKWRLEGTKCHFFLWHVVHAVDTETLYVFLFCFRT